MRGSVVILDATGSIGRAVVQAAVNAERPVIAVSPDRPALARLKASLPRAALTLLPGSIADDHSSALLAADLRKLDRPIVGVVVTIFHEAARGRVLDQSSEALRQTLNEELLPHLAAARALVPLLAEAGRNGSYVVIGGPGGEHPWAGYGHRSISAASVRMLLRVLHDEAHALAVRVQLLAVEMPARTDVNSERACPHWPSAIAIGQRALALIDQTETREPAEAVVRYAWHAIPPSPFDRRAIPAQTTPSPAPSTRVYSAPSRTDMHGSDSPGPSPMPTLDNTWTWLKPLLSSNRKKA